MNPAEFISIAEGGAFVVVTTSFLFLLWWILTKFNESLKAIGNMIERQGLVTRLEIEDMMVHRRTEMSLLLGLQQQVLAHNLSTLHLDSVPEEKVEKAMKQYIELQKILDAQQKELSGLVEYMRYKHKVEK